MRNIMYLTKCSYIHKWTKNKSNPHKLCHQGIWAQVETIGTHRTVLAPSQSYSEVDSTFHYKESITF